jgi:hypothetical protein
MIHVCAAIFDVPENLEKFLNFDITNQGLHVVDVVFLYHHGSPPSHSNTLGPYLVGKNF